MRLTIGLCCILAAINLRAQISPPLQRLPKPGAATGSSGFCGSLVFRNIPPATALNGVAVASQPGALIKVIDSNNRAVAIDSAGRFKAKIGMKYYFTVYLKNCKTPAEFTVAFY